MTRRRGSLSVQACLIEFQPALIAPGSILKRKISTLFNKSGCPDSRRQFVFNDHDRFDHQRKKHLLILTVDLFLQIWTEYISNTKE